jgi:hypothetical protein
LEIWHFKLTFEYASQRSDSDNNNMVRHDKQQMQNDQDLKLTLRDERTPPPPQSERTLRSSSPNGAATATAASIAAVLVAALAASCSAGRQF